MTDKIKQLLENAEQSDAIAKNKWRIENREQLRKERKEKLKELMEKDKQQTAVEIFWNQLPEILPFTVDTATAVKLEEAYKQAKAMHKKEIEDACKSSITSCGMGHIFIELPEQYYNETYGGNK